MDTQDGLCGNYFWYMAYKGFKRPDNFLRDLFELYGFKPVVPFNLSVKLKGMYDKKPLTYTEEIGMNIIYSNPYRRSFIRQFAAMHEVFKKDFPQHV